MPTTTARTILSRLCLLEIAVISADALGAKFEMSLSFEPIPSKPGMQGMGWDGAERDGMGWDGRGWAAMGGTRVWGRGGGGRQRERAGGGRGVRRRVSLAGWKLVGRRRRVVCDGGWGILP